MNYLVTGGSGFIGTNLVSRLIIDPNNTVKIFDREMPRIKKCHWIMGDIEYPPFGDNVFKNIDIVIHLACQPGVEAATKDPIGTLKQNVLGTVNCLEASRQAGVKRFIFASSGGTVLGKQDVPLNENLPPNPSSLYGASKLACEGYCKAYYQTYGLETVILRFSNVYGPYSDKKVFNLIPGFIMNILQEKTCYINGDGTIKKDYIFVEDLVSAIISSAGSVNAAGEIFQLASGTAVNINDAVDIFNEISIELLNRKFETGNRERRIGDVSYECDIMKAQKMLNFEPLHDLKRGIELTFKWFINNWRAKK